MTNTPQLNPYRGTDERPIKADYWSDVAHHTDDFYLTIKLHSSVHQMYVGYVCNLKIESSHDSSRLLILSTYKLHMI